MIPRRKWKLMSRADDRVLLYAGLFVLCALIALPVQAKTQRVEGLAFSRVLVFGDVEVEISQGAESELQLRGNEEDLRRQPFLLDGNTLILGRSPEDPGRNLSDVKYRLQVSQLEELGVQGSSEVYLRELELPSLYVRLDGSGEVRMYGFSGESLGLNLQGSGDIRLAKLSATSFGANVTGSGDVKLGPTNSEKLEFNLNGSGDIESKSEGRVGSAVVRVMGSGDVDLEQVRMARAEVVILGSGDAEIGEVEELNVTILGSGSVVYRGRPDITQSIIGSGELERED